MLLLNRGDGVFPAVVDPCKQDPLGSRESPAMLGRTLLGISAEARALLGTGDSTAGCEGPTHVPSGHTSAPSSLPIWDTE